MNYLTFQKLIPNTSSMTDFSGLEEAIKSTPCYIKEGRDITCSFVMGSTVSSYNSGIVKAHPHSDIDLAVVSKRPHKYRNQYRATLSFQEREIKIDIDINNINGKRLDEEVSYLGDKGVILMSDFVADCHCIENKQAFSHYRNLALLSFLRLGLGYYGDTNGVAPSGAMKAINQGRLMLNPLRWWSIEYAFKNSKNAEQNKMRYYDDVVRMLHTSLNPIDKIDGEEVYQIPINFIIDTNPAWLKILFYSDRLLEMIHSKPALSPNDFNKIKNKAKSLIIGLVEGKTNIDRIFQDKV